MSTEYIDHEDGTVTFGPTGERVEVVDVTATVRFRAYRLASGGLDRIAHELADAIEYHAPHLRDTEEGDALIAVVDGGEADPAVRVHVNFEPSTEPFTAARVRDDIDHAAAWVF